MHPSRGFEDLDPGALRQLDGQAAAPGQPSSCQVETSGQGLSAVGAVSLQDNQDLYICNA